MTIELFLFLAVLFSLPISAIYEVVKREKKEKQLLDEMIYGKEEEKNG